MSIGPSNPVSSSTAGQPAALTHGSEAARAARARLDQKREAFIGRTAASAEGVAETDAESMRPGDRDADGRQPWRLPVPPLRPEDVQKPASSGNAAAPDDTTPQIDLSG